MISWAAIRARLLHIDGSEVTFKTRGFTPSPSQAHLECVGAWFLEGYRQSLLLTCPAELGAHLNAVDPEYRGFCFEGAAMGLALTDFLSPLTSRRWAKFVSGSGAPHVYVAHVALGWVRARLPWLRFKFDALFRSLNPLLRWLAFDGFGFHEGYFQASRYLPPRQALPRLSGYAATAFDQGLGRSLWFSCGADVGLIARVISDFSACRRDDLWSGVGLACSYAGRAEDDQLKQMKALSGCSSLHMAQGVTFAVEARQRGGIVVPHTERACELLCGVSAQQAVAMTHVAKQGLGSESPERPVYEGWRTNLRCALRSVRMECSEIC